MEHHKHIKSDEKSWKIKKIMENHLQTHQVREKQVQNKKKKNTFHLNNNSILWNSEKSFSNNNNKKKNMHVVGNRYRNKYGQADVIIDGVLKDINADSTFI